MPECGICGIKFSNKENLMKHCRIHREKVGYPGTPDPARINRQNRKKRFTSAMFDITLRGVERVAPLPELPETGNGAHADQNQNSVQNSVPEPGTSPVAGTSSVKRKAAASPHESGHAS